MQQLYAHAVSLLMWCAVGGCKWWPFETEVHALAKQVLLKLSPVAEVV